MTTFKIEDNVPVPAAMRKGRNKYPLQQLQPGQSFFVPLGPNAKPTAGKNLKSSMAVRAKKLNISIQTIADDAGVRVWRTE